MFTNKSTKPSQSQQIKQESQKIPSNNIKKHTHTHTQFFQRDKIWGTRRRRNRDKNGYIPEKRDKMI